MSKRFEVGKYAIDNKSKGTAGPQSTIYKTYDAYLLAQSVTRVYGVESPPGQSAMKKLRAEMKACSDRDLLEEYLDYQDRENKRIESIWGEW
jgi:hypothetical protein